MNIKDPTVLELNKETEKRERTEDKKVLFMQSIVLWILVFIGVVAAYILFGK